MIEILAKCAGIICTKKSAFGFIPLLGVFGMVMKDENGKRSLDMKKIGESIFISLVVAGMTWAAANIFWVPKIKEEQVLLRNSIEQVSSDLTEHMEISEKRLERMREEDKQWHRDSKADSLIQRQHLMDQLNIIRMDVKEMRGVILNGTNRSGK